MAKVVTNRAASIRQRLANLARERTQPFEFLLTRYALERLLYRLSLSPYRDRFILKGAMLLTSWIEAPFRGTRDLDFLAYGDPHPDAMRMAFRDICAIDQDDGLVFSPGSMVVEANREDAEYGGLRVKADATLDGARIRIIVDIGFGDRTVPEPGEIIYPVLLDQPAPRLRAYAPETVIAEKFQALVVLGRANSRMKDFYDIWMLARTQRLDQTHLVAAIVATFNQRETLIPTNPPDGLTAAFAADPAKRQWRGFVRDNLAGAEGSDLSLGQLIEDVSAFLMPLARVAAITGNAESG